jgi:ComF family protein
MRGLVANLLFGGSCFLCRGRSRELLCRACTVELPRLGTDACPRCALPTPGAALCGRCLSESPRYDATVAALAYEFAADVLIHALKFRGELALGRFLAQLLSAKIRDRVDYVVPVPLSNRRLRRRGYNQAAEIARHLGRGRLELGLCVRSRDGTPQMELPWAQRQRNVRGAFACRRAIAGATVAVVDDVMTTGATLDEIARTLKAAGASRVINWVVARTLPPA